MPELIERFELSDVHKAGAVFDMERLEWFNSRYIINYDTGILYNKLITYLQRYDKDFLEVLKANDETYNKKILSELKTRLRKLSEYRELTSFFYTDAIKMRTDLLVNPKMKIESLADAKQFLEFALSVIQEKDIDFDDAEHIKNTFIEAISGAGYKNGQILWPVRVALSGEEFSPGALELLQILGKEKSIERLQNILKQIS